MDRLDLCMRFQERNSGFLKGMQALAAGSSGAFGRTPMAPMKIMGWSRERKWASGPLKASVCLVIATHAQSCLRMQLMSRHTPAVLVPLRS